MICGRLMNVKLIFGKMDANDFFKPQRRFLYIIINIRESFNCISHIFDSVLTRIAELLKFGFSFSQSLKISNRYKPIRDVSCGRYELTGSTRHFYRLIKRRHVQTHTRQCDRSHRRNVIHLVRLWITGNSVAVDPASLTSLIRTSHASDGRSISVNT